MKKVITERNTAVLLFVLVLITFSFAQKDSKKLDRLYTMAPLTEKKSLQAKLPQPITSVTAFTKQ